MPPAILIADPHRQARDMTMSLFHALGYRYVWSAEDASRTQNFLDAVIFDYVLIDAQLPGGRISALIETVRAVSKRTKVVVLSHLPNTQERYAADLVLPKPLSFEMVRQMMLYNRGHTTFVS